MPEDDRRAPSSGAWRRSRSRASCARRRAAARRCHGRWRRRRGRTATCQVGPIGMPVSADDVLALAADLDRAGDVVVVRTGVGDVAGSRPAPAGRARRSAGTRRRRTARRGCGAAAARRARTGRCPGGRSALRRAPPERGRRTASAPALVAGSMAIGWVAAGRRRPARPRSRYFNCQAAPVVAVDRVEHGRREVDPVRENFGCSCAAVDVRRRPAWPRTRRAPASCAGDRLRAASPGPC